MSTKTKVMKTEKHFAYYRKYEPRLTSSVKNMLVKHNGNKFIPFEMLDELYVEAGGSPFTYTYQYNDGWYVDKTSKGSFYLGEVESEDDIDTQELFSFIMDNLNWPNIGQQLRTAAENEWYVDKDRELFVPWEWVLDTIHKITKGYGDDIIFSQGDLDLISIGLIE